MVSGLAGSAVMRLPLAKRISVLEKEKLAPTNSAQDFACWRDSMAWRSPQAMMSQWLLGVRSESKTASAAQV
jgi:hypothetical protein